MGKLDDFEKKLGATLEERRAAREAQARENRARFPEAAKIAMQIKEAFGSAVLIDAINNKGEVLVHHERWHKVLEDAGYGLNRT